MSQDFQPLSTREEDRSGRHRQWLAVSVLFVVSVVGVGLWFSQTKPPNPPSPIPEKLPPLGPEQQAYSEMIEIGRLELSRWANFLGQEVVYLDGVVTNRGEQNIVALDVTLEFEDPYGQVVLRQTIRPVGQRLSAFGAPQGPLPAGESRSFRAGFERMPADWNQGAPKMTISGLLLHQRERSRPR